MRNAVLGIKIDIVISLTTLVSGSVSVVVDSTSDCMLGVMPLWA